MRKQCNLLGCGKKRNDKHWLHTKPLVSPEVTPPQVSTVVATLRHEVQRALAVPFPLMRSAHVAQEAKFSSAPHAMQSVAFLDGMMTADEG